MQLSDTRRSCVAIISNCGNLLVISNKIVLYKWIACYS